MVGTPKPAVSPVLGEGIAEAGEDAAGAVAQDLTAAIEAGTAPVIQDGSALRAQG